MTKNLTGVLVPVTTPFDRKNGHIDYGSVRTNCSFFLNAGANGLLAAGSTGEAPLLANGEVASLVRELRTLIPEDKWLIVGTGRESTAATVAACSVAWQHGADAVLVRAPCYFASAMTEQVLVSHFTRVADESPIPVLLYNMPKYTHIDLSSSLVATMAKHQNVMGVKDSSGDLENFKSYRNAAPDWSLLVGSGATFLDGLEAGAIGGVLAVANFAIGLSLDVLEAFNRSDHATATTAQERLTTLHKNIVAGMGPPGVKAAMDLVGLSGGTLRSPLIEVSSDARILIKDLLA